MRRFALALLALSLAAAAAWLMIPRRHVLFPPRASNDTEYVLYTHAPRACRAIKCEALYLLDGERWLPMFARMTEAEHRAGRMPAVVVVGIGYRDIAGTPAHRKHDFTPAFGRTANLTGGADTYLEVLRNDIIPFAEARLPIARGRRALVGHSYGGLFGVYAMARAPDLFDSYLIVSPALWFDDGKTFTLDFASASAPRRAFIAADAPQGETGAMARDAERLFQQLSANTAFVVSREIFPGASHDSVVALAARAGLRTLFSDANSSQ